MRLKSFTAPTATEAMALARAALGDDAIIVATREEEGGVRVTAAIDPAASVLEERQAAKARAPAAPAAPPRPPAPPAESPVDAIYRAFRDHGVPATIGEALLDRAAAFETSDAATALTGALRQTFRFAPVEGARVPGRPREPLMVVGPPGAGKTQTVAKLAARGVMAGRRVALLTTDTDRTGGTAALAAFAQGLRLPLARIETPEMLRGTLAGLDAPDLVVIDAAGRNHLDAGDLVALGRFLVIGGIEPVLVLPAGLDPVEAADIALAYKDFGVRRLIGTRLDMARRLGSMLAAAYAADMAFADFGTTARIKDGLTAADAPTLARFFLPTSRADTARAQQTGTVS